MRLQLRWTFGPITKRVFYNYALCPLSCALWHFDLAHWRLLPHLGMLLVTSRPTITKQTPLLNMFSCDELEIWKGVTKKPHCLQSCDNTSLHSRLRTHRMQNQIIITNDRTNMYLYPLHPQWSATDAWSGGVLGLFGQSLSCYLVLCACL